MPQEVFTYHDGWQTWKVPKGVDSVKITCDGAGSPGNGAGRVTGRRNLGGGTDTLKILVGQEGGSSNGQNGGRTAQGGGGAGGDGNSVAGGDGGGGGSFVRVNSSTGTLVCAAGGAGGTSGDSGGGGRGGASTGESGQRGTSGNNSTSAATGGTQSQGGRGGGSSSGNNFDGRDGNDSAGGRGGAGGDPGGNYGHGGGGGGGGFRPGGGGTASSKGYAPGGGGGGGSNYVGGLKSGAFSGRSGGGGHGRVELEWTTPSTGGGGGGGGGGASGGGSANFRPTTPTNVKVEDKNESVDMATNAIGSVRICADTRDPEDSDIRLLIRYAPIRVFGSPETAFRDPREVKSDLKTTPASGLRTICMNVGGLSQNTLYEARIYAETRGGQRSDSYNKVTFWTNRYPTAPDLHTPHNNVQFDQILPQSFTWTHHDPDPGDNQKGFQIKFRIVSSGGNPGDWSTPHQENTSQALYVSDVREFKANTFYEWQVRTKDDSGHFGAWSVSWSFFASGTTAPPIPLSPTAGQAVNATRESLFTWQFKDPIRTDTQIRADIRYRSVDLDAAPDDPHGPDWVTVIGLADPNEPGTDHEWTFPAGTFAQPGYRYEWQVRTYDALVSLPSDWSTSAFFITIGAPGGGIPPPPVTDPNFIQGSLGCGTYRVCIYDRGGEQYRGEITPIAQLQFGRLRDDISNCLLNTVGFGSDCGALLRRTRSWMHEIVIFRDGVRVWEGPITRITYTRDSVEFEAKDCMAYLYRRIMRQGYNDGYSGKKSETAHGRSVVERAVQIALNALAYQDPNLLPYLTAFIFDNDAHQTRNIPDYSQTAWQQIDDLAANAGLDYTTVGRRIMFWDTHRPIGRLPEMRDGDFSDPPVVTEYGMQLATYSAVTNTTGVWGATGKVTDRDRFLPDGTPNPDFDDWYGPVEMLASSYSETDNQERMQTQSQANIAHRWPTPVVVRVPDNSTLNPETNVGFEQLIPGVWIPLRSDATLRRVEQWQKLDSVTTTFVSGKEQVAVVMSPAPNGGADPDAEGQDVGEQANED